MGDWCRDRVRLGAVPGRYEVDPTMGDLRVSCWLRRLAAVVSGKRLACADPVGVMLILSPIEAIFENPTW